MTAVTPLRPTPVTSLAPQAPTADSHHAALRAAAQQFEAVFMRQLIGSMRQAHLAEDPMSSQATQQFQDMSDASLADSMSHQGTFGIAQMLIQQFDRHVTASAPAAAAGGGDGAQADSSATHDMNGAAQ
jgi:flagellar protein FlgJ